MDSAPAPRPSTVLIAPRPAATAEPISRRAVLIGLLLIPLNAWWFAQIEYVRYSDNCTTSALFFNCLAVLLLLVGVNRLLARWLPRHAFSRGELLTIYAILVVASALCGHDQLQILFTTIVWVVPNATPENRWERDLFPHLPQHLVITDPAVLSPLFSGDSTLYTWSHVRPWLGPLGWWTLFALMLVWTLYCFMAIFRKQWDRERLNYPIAGVPLEMTAPDTVIYRSWLFWAAFGLAAGMQLLRLAHNIWSGVPTVNIGVYNYSFKGMPLSAAGTIPISSYPFSYGLAYLLPLQLAFSVWFFMWFARLEMIASAMLGFTQFKRFPYIGQQGVGAYFGVALFVLYAARQHLRDVWEAACGAGARTPPPSGTDDRPTHAGGVRAPALREPLPYPLAFWGFLAGAAGLVLFATASGMSLGTAIAYFGVFLTIVLTLTRLRSELGLPTIELYQVGADDILQNLVGGRAFAAYLSKLGQEGVLNTSVSGDVAKEAFLQGKAPYMITGPWNTGDFAKAGMDISIEKVPSAGGQPSQPFVGVQGFFISAKSTNALLANEFVVNYLGTEDVQLALYQAGGRAPALQSAFDSIADNPIVAGFGAVGADGVPMPSIPAMDTVWSDWGATEVAIINQTGDPAQLWDKMTAAITSKISAS